MEQAILDFPKQFHFQPRIKNLQHFTQKKKFIVAGMGGSALAAEILKCSYPLLDVLVHRNYGLPILSAMELQHRLIVISSYSGNTEEVIDALHCAMKKKLPLVVLAIGGKALDIAKKEKLPYVQLPDTGIQPRMALGFSLRALMKVCVLPHGLKETKMLADALEPESLKNKGKTLAHQLKNFIPIIYASEKNAAIASNWKTRFHETGKIPTFFNIFPELNHNEMTGFDVQKTTSSLSNKFYFIFLTDQNDHPRIQKRMKITADMLHQRKLSIKMIPLQGQTRLHCIFSSLLLADWTSFFLAKQYGVEPEQVPMVEEFKKLLL